MRHPIAISAALVVACALPVAATADTRVLAGNLPPFSYEGRDEAPGFVVEVARETFKRAGEGITLEFQPWPKAQAMARAEPGVAIIGLTRTPEREAGYAWLAEVLEVGTVFVAVRPAAPVDGFEQAGGLKMLTVRAATPFQEMLKAAKLGNYEPVQSEELNVDKLRLNRADAWLTYDLRALVVWRERGGDPAALVFGKPLAREKLYIAGNRDMPAGLGSKLEAALAAQHADGSYQALYRKYFGER